MSMALEGVLSSRETSAPAAVWRGSTWLMQSRFTCACLLLSIALLRALATSASPRDIPATVGLLGMIALLWEWRARKMGLEITDDGIVAIRVVGSVHLSWSEIASVFTRRAGAGLWDDKTIRIQRKQSLGWSVPVGVGMRLPTLMIFGQASVISRLFGPCDLICGGQRIPQDRVVDFLTEQLAKRTERPPS
jgi:hypothetical protein